MLEPTNETTFLLSNTITISSRYIQYRGTPTSLSSHGIFCSLLLVYSTYGYILNNYLLPPFQGGEEGVGRTYIVLISLEINVEVNESHAHATSYLLLATCAARVHHEA